MAKNFDKWDKKPLYRKVNTRARNVDHNFGETFSKKRGKKQKGNEHKMIKTNRGLDYTPLFKFLLKNVGKKWNDVHSEAVKRLDKQEPIYYMVKMNKLENEYFGVDESSYYNTLYVDDNGILQVINPKFNETTLEPSCPCCTHTFNGKKFTKKYINQNKTDCNINDLL